MLICMKVLLAEKVGGFFSSSPPSFDGFGGQHIGVDRTLIKSGTVSYIRGVLLPRGCLLAACFTGTSPRAASSSSHVGERLQRCSCSADTLLQWGTAGEHKYCTSGCQHGIRSVSERKTIVFRTHYCPDVPGQRLEFNFHLHELLFLHSHLSQKWQVSSSV